MIRRKVFLAALLTLAFTAMPAYAYGPFQSSGVYVENGAPVTVHVDGRYVATDVQPYISSGRTFLPMRAAAEAMDANVSWNNASRTATMTKDGTVVAFTIGSNRYTVNGVSKTTDVTPRITAGRTMLPIRVFAESLGADVEWDGRLADVAITTGGPVTTTPSLPGDISPEVRWLVEKYYVSYDAADHLGSWYCGRVGGSGQHERYIFVSAMNDGSKQAVTVDYNADSYDVVSVCIADVRTQSDGFLADVQMSPPHYYYGPSMGLSGDATYDFRYANGDLVMDRMTFTDGGYTSTTDIGEIYLLMSIY